MPWPWQRREPHPPPPLFRHQCPWCGEPEAYWSLSSTEPTRETRLELLPGATHPGVGCIAWLEARIAYLEGFLAL